MEVHLHWLVASSPRRVSFANHYQAGAIHPVRLSSVHRCHTVAVLSLSREHLHGLKGIQETS